LLDRYDYFMGAIMENHQLNYEKTLRRCSAYCTAASYRLPELLVHLQLRGLAASLFRSGNVVHRPFSTTGDIFYFSYGTMVTWGLSKEEEEALLLEVKAYEENPNEQMEWEESRYVLGQAAKILKDDITLPANDVLTKLAFSHGLAQSVKLSVFEKLIERRIESSREAPMSLAKKGRISMSHKKLARMMGQIIIDRNSINLHTDILDTPEFFWEYSDLEPLYRLIAQDLDIAARVSVLNKRLDIVKDLIEMLSNELQHRHSARLEWIIITLIFIEVMVTFAKEVFQII
jgi:uncharacterized Rmd1/YagE family protein